MRFDKFSFGSIQIDGITRDYDVVIDGGEIRERKKKTSKQFRDEMACSVFRKAARKAAALLQKQSLTPIPSGPSL